MILFLLDSIHIPAGKVVKADVGGCTQKDVEISMIKMFVVSAAAGILPFKVILSNKYFPLILIINFFLIVFAFNFISS